MTPDGSGTPTEAPDPDRPGDRLSRGLLAVASWSQQRPRRALAVVAALVVLAAPGLLRLELRTDGHALVPPHDPAVLVDDEVREHFGLQDPIVVFVEARHPDGIFNPETLRRVQDLSRALGELPGVADVSSLATESRDRVYPGTLNFRPYLDPLPESEKRLAELRSDLEAAPILTGTLVTPPRADGVRTGTSILLGVAQGIDRHALYRQVLATADSLRGEGPEADEILVVGAPVAEALLGVHILEDLAVVIPLSLLVIGVVLWLGCRRLSGVMLGLAEVGACQLFTFGAMGWLGVPVYLTTAVLPVILTTVGLADEIHVFWHFQGLLARAAPDADHRPLVTRTLAAMVRPVVLTSLTTSLGFLSFLTSEIPPVRTFGIFAAVGILFCLLFTLLAVPAALTLLPGRALRPSKVLASGPEGSSEGRIIRWLEPCLRRRRLTLGLLLAVSLFAAAGLRHLVVQDSWIDGFARGSAFRQATDHVNEALYGTHLLLAHLTFPLPPGAVPAAPPPGQPDDPARLEALARQQLGLDPAARPLPLLDPEVLEAIGEFEAFARRQEGVGGVVGTHSHLTNVAYLWLARREGSRAIPQETAMVERLLRRFDQGRGEHRRRQVLDDERLRTVVTIFLKDANYRQTAALMETLEQAAQRTLGPYGARLDFAGDVAVSQAMIPAIVRTQGQSLLLAVVGALVVLAWLYRSPRRALLAILPTAFAVLWVFGAMGWLGIPLGVATSMFCAITLGIGVDYAIHLLERFHRARQRQQEDPTSWPARQAVAEAGPAIVADTLAIGAGFGLLALSQVPANAYLGLLVALALGAACLLTLAGLGALLSRPKRAIVKHR